VNGGQIVVNLIAQFMPRAEATHEDFTFVQRLSDARDAGIGVIPRNLAGERIPGDDSHDPSAIRRAQQREGLKPVFTPVQLDEDPLLVARDPGLQIG
jgi:hypothetical protein